MTQQEIEERNKQIALMLGTIKGRDPFGNFIDGIQYNKIGTEREWCFHFNQTALKTQTSAVSWKVLYKIEELRFHSDWNWLMEAVEFIQKELIKNNDEFCIEFYEGLPGESMTFVSYAEQNVESKSSKEAVFIAVSDFAKLYNEKKL